MPRDFYCSMDECPVIAAVKDQAGLERALKSGCGIIFVLFGTICNIGEIVERIRQADKFAIVHIDLIDGLESKDISVQFLKRTTSVDGIISTKAPLIKSAKEHGLIAVQRFFLIDSMALSNIKKQLESGHADVVEILPALVPKVISQLCRETKIPLICGGLISDKEDIVLSLSAGARAVSSTRPETWFM